uniref:Uncharacterized protein n=1 Tax=Meloidogyne incognita TaxID=6306 RepID=A0A914LNF5_MELIC
MQKSFVQLKIYASYIEDSIRKSFSSPLDLSSGASVEFGFAVIAATDIISAGVRMTVGVPSSYLLGALIGFTSGFAFPVSTLTSFVFSSFLGFSNATAVTSFFFAAGVTAPAFVLTAAVFVLAPCLMFGFDLVFSGGNAVASDGPAAAVGVGTCTGFSDFFSFLTAPSGLGFFPPPTFALDFPASNGDFAPTSIVAASFAFFLQHCISRTEGSRNASIATNGRTSILE